MNLTPLESKTESKTFKEAVDVGSNADGTAEESNPKHGRCLSMKGYVPFNLQELNTNIASVPAW